MASVTGRIKKTPKPGQYVPRSLFEVETYKDGNEVKYVGKELSSIQGLAVDYLTRYMLTGDKKKAFEISLTGAMLGNYLDANNSQRAEQLLDSIKGLRILL